MFFSWIYGAKHKLWYYLFFLAMGFTCWKEHSTFSSCPHPGLCQMQHCSVFKRIFYSLVSRDMWCFNFVLYISFLSPKFSHFSRADLFLLFEMVLEIYICILWVFIATGKLSDIGPLCTMNADVYTVFIYRDIYNHTCKLLILYLN